MKQRTLPFVSALLLLLFATGMATAADSETHRAFKVTSYDLGTIDNFQGKGPLASRNFQPLLITSSIADILNSGQQSTVSASGGISDLSPISSFAISGRFDATNTFSLQGAIGVTRNLWKPDLLGDLNDASWEANLGVIYRFFNNLSYELHFGYMDTGRVFSDRNSYSDVESIIMISNKITLSF